MVFCKTSSSAGHENDQRLSPGAEHAQLGLQAHGGEEGEEQQVAQGHVEIELDAGEAPEQRRANAEQHATGDRPGDVVVLQQRQARVSRMPTNSTTMLRIRKSMFPIWT